MLIERQFTVSKLQQRLEARRTDNGFALIELPIVIVVLGVVVSVIAFGVVTFRADAQAGVCRADKKTISIAAVSWIATKNATPTLADLVDGQYLKAAPTSVTSVTIAADGTVAGTCVA